MAPGCTSRTLAGGSLGDLGNTFWRFPGAPREHLISGGSRARLEVHGDGGLENQQGVAPARDGLHGGADEASGEGQGGGPDAGGCDNEVASLFG